VIRNILSAIVFLPLLGAAFVLVLSRDDRTIHKYVALMIGLVTFVLSCLLVANFDHTQAGIQFAENYEWITSPSHLLARGRRPPISSSYR